MTTLLVTGSRNLIGADHGTWVKTVLTKAHKQHNFTLLVEGGAKGADSIAAEWAVANQIKVFTYPAEWGKYGKKAGTLRNIEMLDNHPGAIVFAFPVKDSKGTRHCIREAQKRDHLVVVTEM